MSLENISSRYLYYLAIMPIRSTFTMWPNYPVREHVETAFKLRQGMKNILSCVKKAVWSRLRSPTRATLGDPTFPTFPYKTWRTVYMRNKRLARLEVKSDPPSRVTLLRWSGHPPSRANFSPRRDNQSMRERCWLGQRCQLFLSYKRSLKLTRLGGDTLSWHNFSPCNGALDYPACIYASMPDNLSPWEHYRLGKTRLCPVQRIAGFQKRQLDVLMKSKLNLLFPEKRMFSFEYQYISLNELFVAEGSLL